MPISAKPLLGGCADPAHWLSAGQVGLWLLHERSGLTARNLAPGRKSGSDGVFENLPTWTHGLGGYGLNFTGGTQAVNLGTGAEFQTDATGSTTTIEAWIRCATPLSGTSGLIIGKANQTSNSSPMFGLVMAGTSGRIQVYFAGLLLNSASHVFTADRLHHVVATFTQGGSMSLWLDGVYRTSAAISTTTTTVGSRAAIGCNIRAAATYTLPFTGDIYKCGWWNRVLSEQEIDQLFHDPYAQFRIRRTVFGSSSASSFAATAAGGVVLGGAVSVVGFVVSTASAGGVLIDGGASSSVSLAATAAGGVELGGAASSSFSSSANTATAAGGVELGGAASVVSTSFEATAAGGVELGGAASVVSTSGIFPTSRLVTVVTTLTTGLPGFTLVENM